MARVASALSAIARRIADFAGLDPPAWVLEARARERAARLELDLERYATRLVDDAGELAALVEALRVGETRFFRHQAHIASLRDAVIPERARAGVNLRAWSAGCATGEEAWTLAILLAEAVGEKFDLVATDLSAGALEVARAGRYPRCALAEIPAATRARFFVEEERFATVAAPLRRRVRFERKNLLDLGYPTRQDIILCRNVLIYFEEARRDQVVERLAESLAPGGYLFLGYSETLRSHADLFEARRNESGSPIYRRARPSRSLCERPHKTPQKRPHSPFSARAPGHADDDKSSRSDAGVRPIRKRSPTTIRLSGDYSDDRVERLSRELRPLLEGGAHRVDLDGATFLGDEAARVLDRIATASPGRLALYASRPPIRRWLAQHDLGARFTVEEAPKSNRDE